MHIAKTFLDFRLLPKIRIDETSKTCYSIKALENASVAQSVEQLIRNQQVAGSSPATSSTKPVKIVRFSPVFSFICSEFTAAKPPDPHRDPHGEMSKERRRG